MKGPFLRGDLDRLVQQGAAGINLLLITPNFGFILGCHCCGSNALAVRYEGKGVLRFQCVDCGRELVPISVAEGRGHSDEALNEIRKIAPACAPRRN